MSRPSVQIMMQPLQGPDTCLATDVLSQIGRKQQSNIFLLNQPTDPTIWTQQSDDHWVNLPGWPPPDHIHINVCVYIVWLTSLVNRLEKVWHNLALNRLRECSSLVFWLSEGLVCWRWRRWELATWMQWLSCHGPKGPKPWEPLPVALDTEGEHHNNSR